MNFEQKEYKIKFIMTILITAMITFLITAWIYTNYYTSTNSGVKKVLTSQVKGVDIDNYEDIFKLVKLSLNKYFLGELNDEDMKESAIKGYVKGTGDPYTEYLTESEYESLKSSISGDYVGIGVYVSQDKNEQVVVLLPIEESPAEEAEIKTGDIILKANGEELTGLDLDVAVNKIKGKEGTTVELEIMRDGEIINKTLERRKIVLKDMDSKMLDRKYWIYTINFI